MSKHVWLAVMLLIAAIARAQTKPTDWSTVKALATGADVRVTIGARSVHGKVLRATDDSLVLALGKSQEMFAQQEVKRVLLRGDSHRGLGSGAAIGAIIGAGAHHDCSGWCIFNTSRGVDAAAGAIVTGGIGAIVGALIPARSWLEVYRQ
jgi:hypothetical protein